MWIDGCENVERESGAVPVADEGGVPPEKSKERGSLKNRREGDGETSMPHFRFSPPKNPGSAYGAEKTDKSNE